MTKLNGKSGKKGKKKSLVFTKKKFPKAHLALRIVNQDVCARLVISRVAQDTGRLYSIETNDNDRKIMLHSYIAKPIVWRILQEVYLPVSMLSMLINHDKTRKLNAFSLPQFDAYLNCLVFNSISLYCGLIKNNAVDVGDNTSLDNRR